MIFRWKTTKLLEENIDEIVEKIWKRVKRPSVSPFQEASLDNLVRAFYVPTPSISRHVGMPVRHRGIFNCLVQLLPRGIMDNKQTIKASGA